MNSKNIKIIMSGVFFVLIHLVAPVFAGTSSDDPAVRVLRQDFEKLSPAVPTFGDTIWGWSSDFWGLVQKKKSWNCVEYKALKGTTERVTQKRYLKFSSVTDRIYTNEGKAAPKEFVYEESTVEDKTSGKKFMIFAGEAKNEKCSEEKTIYFLRGEGEEYYDNYGDLVSYVSKLMGEITASPNCLAKQGLQGEPSISDPTKWVISYILCEDFSF